MHLYAITTTFDHFSTLDPYGLANLGDGTPGLYTEVHHRGTNPVSRRHPTSGFIDSSHTIHGLDFFRSTSHFHRTPYIPLRDAPRIASVFEMVILFACCILVPPSFVRFYSVFASFQF